MYTREGEGGRLKKCFHYPINRMRCWKVGCKVLAVTWVHCIYVFFQGLCHLQYRTVSCCLATVPSSTPWSRKYKALQGRTCLHQAPPLLCHWANLLNPLPHTLTHMHTSSYFHTHTPSHSQEGSHWVSFHFQQSRDELVWVTVVGKAAIFLALCLHSAVDELLWQHNNKPIRKPSENVSKGGTQCFQENTVELGLTDTPKQQTPTI